MASLGARWILGRRAAFGAAALVGGALLFGCASAGDVDASRPGRQSNGTTWEKRMGTILPAVGALAADFGGLDEAAGRRDAAWGGAGESAGDRCVSLPERAVARCRGGAL